jgi:hypothetical protein
MLIVVNKWIKYKITLYNKIIKIFILLKSRNLKKEDAFF